jgi:CubicO group peptidase (beta-lactamase class C family)
MNSGLEFNERYDTGMSDTNRQYRTGDYAGYTAAKPLVAKPGETFNYSTGTSNLIGRIVREAAGPKMSDGFAFPRQALFDPIGMRTAVLETDAVGSLQGGSFVYASARDYARFGLLYLRDGLWNGVRILPEGWVAYTRTPTVGAPANRSYGAQFWLNSGIDQSVRRYPSVPADAYMMIGILGQHTFIVPSRDLVLVRVGLSEYDNWDPSILVADVIAAIAPQS